MSWLSIEKATESPYWSSLKELVRQQETCCIDAVSMLTGNEGSKPIIAHSDGNTVDAALFFTSYGRIMPVLAPQFFFHMEDVKETAYLAGNTVYLPTSVSGKTEAVDMFLEKFSCGQHQQVIEHYIMELESPHLMQTLPEPPDKLQIHMGSRRHILPLFPLQKTYERQEVLLNPEAQDLMETFRWLKSILTTETCFYARLGLHYVSKANTNAKGFDHIQIGGVFTVPKFRNQGYALHTVAALCRHILEQEHKKPSLFVKTDNENAINLYKKLGFEIKNKTKTVYLN